MNLVHLKPKVSGSTHGTQQNELKNAPPKSTVQKLTEPTPGVAWPWALLGQRRGGGGVAYTYPMKEKIGVHAHLKLYRSGVKKKNQVKAGFLMA